MTNQQGTPEAMLPIARYKIGYHTDEWGMRSSTPGGITDPSGQWVLYKDHIAALASHGQAPAVDWSQVGLLLDAHATTRQFLTGTTNWAAAICRYMTKHAAPQPADSGEPVGYLYCGGSYGDELADWEIVAEQLQCDRLNEHHGALGKEAKLPLYTAPQPVEREPLTPEQMDAALGSAKKVKPGYVGWVTDQRRELGRAVERAHGIKGGQHGTE